MLKRKIETYLAKWKESKDRKPLVILGSGGAFCIFFARKSFQVFSGFSLTTTSPSFVLVLPPALNERKFIVLGLGDAGKYRHRTRFFSLVEFESPPNPRF